jgi:hypothetical protein
MRKIKDITDTYKSVYAAAKALQLPSSKQLGRYVKMDAMVDTDGQVWIKSGSPIAALKGGAT